MPLTQEQAFKIGFLQAAAEEGLSIEETKLRVKQAIASKRAGRPLEKQAWLPGLTWMGGKFIQAVPSLAAIGATSAGVLGVGLPVGLGATAGYVAGKMNNDDGKSLVEDAKNEEIVGEYNRLAEEARRRSRLKKLQQNTGRQVVALGG